MTVGFNLRIGIGIGTISLVTADGSAKGFKLSVTPLRMDAR